MSRLIIMGSGETAPTMVKVHREVLRETHAEAGGGPAAFVDTPFGFQMNADELTARTRTYFAESVGHDVEVARWRRADEPVADRERTLALLARATWAFAGPGSPSYALRQWTGTPVPDALAGVVERGGTLVLGSAAAVTLGSHAIPVYEIYKVGEEPRWLPALDLLHRFTGIRAAVVPHFDNAEGGSHDTRFCYLGEQRLQALEADLPDEAGVLGVDEHTAAWIDLQARTLRVLGNGVVTVRRRGATATFGAGEVLDLDELRTLLEHGPGGAIGSRPARAATTHATASGDGDGDATAEDVAAPATSLRASAEAARRSFDAALQGRDVTGCVTAVLELEQEIHDWSTDMLQSDDADVARRVLRSMVSELGSLAERGASDPRDVVSAYVDLLLELRARARAAKDFDTSDLVRDRLGAAGVEVRDTPDGAEWSLR